MKLILFFNLIIILIFSYIDSIDAWFNSEDILLLDLIEDVNQNFYHLLGLNQAASIFEIKKSFRSLSLKYHPDKNKTEGAEKIFRNLVSVVEVLKDEQKRKKYDEILKNGLPNWKSGIYYYRRVKKLNLWEFSLIVSIVFTIGHYLCLISSYWERKFEINEMVKKRSKKLSKQEIIEMKNQIFDSMGLESPKFYRDNLLIKVIRFNIWFINVLVFWSIQYFYKMLEYSKKKKETQQNMKNEKDEKKKKVKNTILNQFPDFNNIYKNDLNIHIPQPKIMETNFQKECEKIVEPSNVWKEEEIFLLIKLTKKYPSGTHERWEKIADILSKNVNDVINKAKELKTISKSSYPSNNVSRIDKDQKKHNFEKQKWTQVQQKSLEEALKKYPKEYENRWDAIALLVAGKSKEECIKRFNFIADLIKLKKKKL